MEEKPHEKACQEKKKLIQRVDIIEPLVEVGHRRFEPGKGKVNIDGKGDAGEEVKDGSALFGKDNEQREKEVEDQFVTNAPGSRGDVSMAICYREKPCQVIKQPEIRGDDIADEHG